MIKLTDILSEIDYQSKLSRAHKPDYYQLGTSKFIPFDEDETTEAKKRIARKKGQKKKWERVLTGGTDFDAPTKYVNKGKFDGHIVLTDMCAPKPVSSKCQRMWMTDSHNARNPYFKTQERVIPIDH